MGEVAVHSRSRCAWQRVDLLQGASHFRGDHCQPLGCDDQIGIPSGELTVCYGKSPFLMGKSMKIHYK